MKSCTLENRLLSVTLDLTNGIELHSIYDKVLRHEYVKEKSPLMKWAAGNSDYRTVAIAERTVLSEDRTKLRVDCRDPVLSLAFTARFAVHESESILTMELEITNCSEENRGVRLIYPSIQGIQLPGSSDDWYGTVPQEIGSLAKLSEIKRLGMNVQTLFAAGHERKDTEAPIGVPTNMNTLELACLYNGKSGGGIFILDGEGDWTAEQSPIQLSFEEMTIRGLVREDIPPAESVRIAKAVIGLFAEGDWRVAVNYYTSIRQSRMTFPEIPAWLRESGAIYATTSEGGGGPYQLLPTVDLKSRIASFEELPRLLEEARRFHTDIVYIYDFWEGAEQGDRPPYWNKGDYVPRSDLGGEAAFVRGIEEIHRQGGKVILYLEPFIVYRYSELGQQIGDRWAGRNHDGKLYDQYIDNYTMVASYAPWQNYVVAMAEKFVGKFGADGVFLDSWGWQWNWPIRNEEEKRNYTPKQFSQGVIELTRKVRSAIRLLKPDAVVLAESGGGPLVHHLDGGLSADFAWLKNDNNAGKLIGSPVRYGIPEANFFTNGQNLCELHQVFAAGHHLALCHEWLPFADYIGRLVQIRQTYKDALVYGKLKYQPAASQDCIIAYHFRGSKTDVITIVNISPMHCQGKIAIIGDSPSSTWQEMLCGETVLANHNEIKYSLLGGGMAVFVGKSSEN